MPSGRAGGGAGGAGCGPLAGADAPAAAGAAAVADAVADAVDVGGAAASASLTPPVDAVAADAVTAEKVQRAPVVTDADRASARFQPVLPTFPGLLKVSTSPPIYTVDGFLSPAECAALMAQGGAGLKRSIVVDGTAGKSAAPSRTSESCYLPKEETVWLADRVTALLGKPAATQEPPQVARYTAGQHYLPHFDAFDVTTAPGRECCATGGQRVATVLVYLNAVPRGGATAFPRLGVSFSPTPGKALVFFPCDLEGRLDPLALHAAEDALDEKWVAQVWVRERDFV